MKNRVKQLAKNAITFIVNITVFIKRKYQERDNEYKQELADYYLGKGFRHLRPFIMHIVDDAMFDYQNNVEGKYEISIGTLRGANEYRKEIIKLLNKYTA